MKLQIGIDGKTYEVEVEVLEDDAIQRQPNYGPYPVVPSTVSAAASVPRTQPPTAEENVDEEKLCRSPVAGVVIKVNVTAGQSIQANDLIVVLEAMKMETNVTAPVAGKIKSIRVQPGDPVQIGQVLVEFE